MIVNGENAAGGRGITGRITIDLLRAGVSVITTGDHIWDQKEILSFIDTEPRLLRPVNYPEGAPGSGSIVLETAKGKIGVLNVQARTFMQPILENPFRASEAAVIKMREETRNIIVDVHGETTSERIAMGRFLTEKSPLSSARTLMFRQRTSKSFRRHCFHVRCRHVRTGEFHLGPRIDPILNRFISNLPASFPVAGGEVRLRGALIEIDESTGRAVRISRVDEPGPSERCSRRARAKDRHRTTTFSGTDLKLLRLQPTVDLLSFEFSRNINVQQKP